MHVIVLTGQSHGLTQLLTFLLVEVGEVEGGLLDLLCTLGVLTVEVLREVRKVVNVDSKL